MYDLNRQGLKKLFKAMKKQEKFHILFHFQFVTYFLFVKRKRKIKIAKSLELFLDDLLKKIVSVAEEQERAKLTGSLM